MMRPSLDNPKIVIQPGSGEPKFARFGGFTYLFDGGARSVSEPDCNGLCKLDDPGKAPLYRALAHTVSELGTDASRVGLSIAWLCPSSWHVTALGGLDDACVEQLREGKRQEFTALLGAFPGALPRLTHRFPSIPERISARSITLSFGQLDITGEGALVARLDPANRDSGTALEEFDRRRSALRMTWANDWGLPKVGILEPHISLAYFASSAAADKGRALLSRWQVLAERNVSSESIVFGDAAVLFAFTDMESFYCLATKE